MVQEGREGADGKQEQKLKRKKGGERDKVHEKLWNETRAHDYRHCPSGKKTYLFILPIVKEIIRIHRTSWAKWLLGWPKTWRKMMS